jgi:hypothetical protein
MVTPDSRLNAVSAFFDACVDSISITVMMSPTDRARVSAKSDRPRCSLYKLAGVTPSVGIVYTIGSIGAYAG